MCWLWFVVFWGLLCLGCYVLLAVRSLSFDNKCLSLVVVSWLVYCSRALVIGCRLSVGVVGCRLSVV